MRVLFSYRATWSQLRQRSGSPVLRIAASFATGAMVSALMLGAAWLHMATRGRTLILPSRMLRVDPDGSEVAIALTVGGIIWAMILLPLWRPGVAGEPRKRDVSPEVPRESGWELTGAVCLTLLLIFPLIASVNAIESSHYVPGDKKFLHSTLWIAVAGVVTAVWLPAICIFEKRWLRPGRPVLGSDGQVDVRCPGCGYLLVDLRDLRCPECGKQFTIDELILAQRYESPRTESIPSARS